MIVLFATFKLQEASADEVAQAREVYETHIQQRKDRHPLEYPNTGSVFKNIREPEKIAEVLRVFPDLEDQINTKWYGKVASASLIQRLGLQGFRVGDAEVSKKHALFIVNLHHATARDVTTVIDTVQKKFKETFGFTLEPEVEIVQE
jgi:UDP-N-acetylmuramate dehydrogenase